MKRHVSAIVLCTALAVVFCSVAFAQDASAAKPFEPTWESLQKYECPEWFQDAKFGIYAHWGPYAVPAYGSEWYSHYMYFNHRKRQEKVYGPLKTFGYKDFVPDFKGEKFNADEWAELYRKAGAKFAGPVAEHADGFSMWDSKLTEWDSVEKGPERDIVAELEKAIRKRDMKFVATFHHQWLWGWYPTYDETTDADLLEKPPVSVTMPGSDAKVKWTRDAKAMTFALPDELPCEHVYVFRIDLE